MLDEGSYAKRLQHRRRDPGQGHGERRPYRFDQVRLSRDEGRAGNLGPAPDDGDALDSRWPHVRQQRKSKCVNDREVDPSRLHLPEAVRVGAGDDHVADLIDATVEKGDPEADASGKRIGVVDRHGRAGERAEIGGSRIIGNATIGATGHQEGSVVPRSIVDRKRVVERADEGEMRTVVRRVGKPARLTEQEIGVPPVAAERDFGPSERARCVDAQASEFVSDGRPEGIVGRL